MTMYFCWLIIFVIGVCTSVTIAQKPNIVFVLTDDQDVFVGGQYVASPLCCPSRSSILTGKYVSTHHAYNNSINGGCSSPEWQQTQETQAFPVYLKKQQYTTFFAGKYLNQYGMPKSGGVKHVPPGWDWWNGLVGNSKYYNYKLSVNGTMESHGHNPDTDYLTDLINRRATDFLNQRSPDEGPFFMMLSTPSAHAPFTPAPKYQNNFADKQAPGTPSFNTHGKNKHWLIEQALTPMPNDTITNIDDIFRNRWRTLLSVDDMVENVVNILTQKNMINNTYIFFSSDNGYHLGQFSLPNDKRQLYEFDNRVPFMVRGPGIKAGSMYKFPVSSIDLAPTFLDIAGSPIPVTMEGESILRLLTTQDNNRSPPIFLEHYGEHTDSISGCPQYKGQGMANCNNHCVCEDSHNNTFSCVLTWTGADRMKLCSVQEDIGTYMELYDLLIDEDELKNLIDFIDQPGYEKYKELIRGLRTCKHKNHLQKLLRNCRGERCQNVLKIMEE